MNTIPIGLRKSYYINLADSYYSIGQIDSAHYYYLRAMDSWCYRRAFEYRAAQEKSLTPSQTFYQELLIEYDRLMGEKCDIQYMKNAQLIDSMYYSDQDIRKALHESIKSNDSIKRQQLQVEMRYVDSINYKRYDSLATIYGWVSQDMNVNKNYSADIILFHQNKDVYYSYIKRGYKLARENKVDWYNVYNLQSYALGRVNSFHLDKVDFIDYYSLALLREDKEVLLFFSYSLFQSVVTSNFLGMENKVQLFATNHSKSGWSDRGIYSLLKRVRRKAIRLGLDKDRIILEKANYVIENENAKNVLIGTKRL